MSLGDKVGRIAANVCFTLGLIVAAERRGAIVSESTGSGAVWLCSISDGDSVDCRSVGLLALHAAKNANTIPE